MKKKLPVLVLLLAAVIAVFLPAVSLHVHSQLGAETTALFPANISLWQIMTRGIRCLPADQVPAMKLMYTAQVPLTVGMLLLLAGCVMALLNRAGTGTRLSLLFSCGALIFLGTGVFQWMNLSGSLLFTVLLTVQAAMYIPVIAAVVLILLDVLALRHQAPLLTDDRKWRLLSIVLAVMALLVMLLPVYVINAPETLTANPADAAAANRSVSMYQMLLGSEPNLYTIGQDKQVFTDTLSGDLKALEPYSGDGNNIRGIFMIRGNSSVLNTLLLAGAVLLLLTAVLGLIPKADRWFPLVMSAMAALLLATGVLSIMQVGEADMYASASRQLLKLGIGHVTPVAPLAVLLALCSACAGALGVHYANEPYFVNPLPASLRIRTVAAALAVLALVCMRMPNATVSFTKANKNKVQATAELRGIDALTLTAADSLADPKDSKGKDVYTPDEAEYPIEAVNAATASTARLYTGLTWASLCLTLLALLLLILKKPQKWVIALLIAALVLRVATWLALSRSLPRAVVTAGGTIWLYASLPLLIFAAFFAHFAHLEEMPNKYRLFLLMLPFLVAVFLFSYLPLYGWSYAFYNYKFGLPMDQQEFVGLKWFTEMFTNMANRENIVRVLKNTLGMSGLNLATSWLPMIFAVFLNEITRTRFKKFVQIFTTLPNFISWALVFSFAMCLFAADTGIYSKLMMSLGMNDPNNPTVWLNSGQHIWLKMWGWSTWKGLGWGAIMYLAAISGIDQELYEAARVDGANRWALMRHITLPSLLPTFFVLLMLSISNILNNGMEQYLVFQNPMNRQTIEVLDLYVYNITIASRGTTLYSYATAIGILKTVVSVTLLFSANFLSKKLRGESIM